MLLVRSRTQTGSLRRLLEGRSDGAASVAGSARRHCGKKASRAFNEVCFPRLTRRERVTCPSERSELARSGDGEGVAGFRIGRAARVVGVARVAVGLKLRLEASASESASQDFAAEVHGWRASAREAGSRRERVKRDCASSKAKKLPSGVQLCSSCSRLCASASGRRKCPRRQDRASHTRRPRPE